ncbi:MAG TPA: prepilin-type N-terminal cleavage/methylation domain-containing protein [Candidatus Nanoarchaeia archaeon]
MPRIKQVPKFFKNKSNSGFTFQSSGKQSPKGFTLIELLIVISIIAILVAIAAFSYSLAQKRTRNGQRQSDLNKFSLALEEYFADHREYPTASQINCMVTGSGGGCEAPFNVYMTRIPLDPLDNTPYTYSPTNDTDLGPGTRYQNYTLSANKEGFTYSITKPD